MKIRLKAKPSKKIMIIVGIFCILVLILGIYVVWVYTEPWYSGGEVCPTALLEVKKNIIGDEESWNVTVVFIDLNVSPEMVSYRITNDGDIVETGKLQNNNLIFIDVDNSSTLSKGDILCVVGKPHSQIMSGDKFQLLFKDSLMAEVELE